MFANTSWCMYTDNVLSSKTSIASNSSHCNGVGFSPSFFLPEYRDGAYSRLPLSNLFYSLKAILCLWLWFFLLVLPVFNGWVVFLIRKMHERACVWSLDDRLCRTTSLFKMIPGRHKTLYFSLCHYFCQLFMRWIFSLFFPALSSPPCVGLLYISALFFSLAGLISAVWPSLFPFLGHLR